MGPRAGISSVLVLGGIVLLISIVVGNSMGNRVLGQVASRGNDFAPSPIASPSADASDSAASELSWKRRQVLSVATDPGFPDPRITPEPVIPATPRPRPKPTPTPTPEPSPLFDETESPYTSPPLPIPIVSHDPNEQSDPYGEPIPTASPSPQGSESPRPGASAR
jgi:hypothetical protein